ncbi:MAG: hypothetical protein LBK28_09085, partial [Propionibacteriaceae bacterium]|nr:hypothetical protein [Propionibacteriaceae bacterium]
EKTYALAIDLSEGIKDMLNDNPGEAYLQLFMNYALGFIKQFQEYCKRPDINIVEDRSGFSLVPIYATDEEIEQAILGYAEVIKPLRDNLPASDRKLRTLGLIVAPPQTYKE